MFGHLKGQRCSNRVCTTFFLLCAQPETNKHRPLSVNMHVPPISSQSGSFCSGCPRSQNTPPKFMLCDLVYPIADAPQVPHRVGKYFHQDVRRIYHTSVQPVPYALCCSTKPCANDARKSNMFHSLWSSLLAQLSRRLAVSPQSARQLLRISAKRPCLQSTPFQLCKSFSRLYSANRHRGRILIANQCLRHVSYLPRSGRRQCRFIGDIMSLAIFFFFLKRGRSTRSLEARSTVPTREGTISMTESLHVGDWRGP